VSHRTFRATRNWDARREFLIGPPFVTAAQAESRCGDCGAPIDYRVEGGRLLDAHGEVHFAVRAQKWWDDIGYT